MPIKNFVGVVRGTGGTIGLGAKVDRDGGPFAPNSLPGLVAWYDASAITGLVDDAAVTSWPDSTGAGNVLNEWQGPPRYVLADALLGGAPSVRFDGSASIRRSSPTGLPVAAQASTTYIVGYIAGSGNRTMFGWGDNTVGRLQVSAGGDNVGTFVCAPGAIGATAGVLFVNNVPFIYTFPYVAGAAFGSSTTYFNGTLYSGAFSPAYSAPVMHIVNPVAEFAIGRPCTFPGGERWNGAVAEIIVYNVTHTATERNQVTSYLSSKYGISVV